MSKGKYKRKREQAQKQVQKNTPQVSLHDGEVDDPQQETTSQAGKSERKHEEEDAMRLSEGTKLTDWLIAIFTGALVATSIYQFIIMGGQLNTMRTDQRAWLKFEAYSNTGEAGKFNTTITAGQPVTYPLRVDNIGKTPAKNVVMKIFVDIVDSSQEPPLEHVEDAKVGSPYPFGLIQSGIVFPNTDFRQLVIRPTKGGGPLVATDSEVSAVTNGRAYLAVYGIIEYDDVFHTRHWTKFCKWIAGNGTFTTERCTKYNGVDDN